jgi:hypothetical protein
MTTSYPEPGTRVKIIDLTKYPELNNIIGTCDKVLSVEPFDPLKDKEPNYNPTIIIRLDFMFKGSYRFKLKPKNYCVGISCPPPTQKEMNNIFNFTKTANVQENVDGSLSFTLPK